MSASVTNLASRERTRGSESVIIKKGNFVCSKMEGSSVKRGIFRDKEELPNWIYGSREGFLMFFPFYLHPCS
jgi:hypothetical protein